MAETHVISALTTKYAQLQGKIQLYQKLIKETKTNLDIISKSIKIFDPNYDLRKIKLINIRNRYFKYGELNKIVIEYLKINDGVSIYELVNYIMELKSVPKNLYKIINIEIYGVIKRLLNNDVVELEINNNTKLYKIKS